MTSTFPNSRPGGRAANVTARITQAAIDLLIEGGIEACTFANVADRAAVQRSTLYRRYDDRWAMIMEAIANRADTTMTATGEGTFANDLRDVLTKLGAALASPLGAAGMMAASRSVSRAPSLSRVRVSRTSPARKNGYAVRATASE